MNRDWRQNAKCLGADQRPFFSPSSLAQQWVIRTFCLQCPVITQCRALADQTDPVRPYGVFGGATARQRQEERRAALRQAS